MKAFGIFIFVAMYLLLLGIVVKRASDVETEVTKEFQNLIKPVHMQDCE